MQLTCDLPLVSDVFLRTFSIRGYGLDKKDPYKILKIEYGIIRGMTDDGQPGWSSCVYRLITYDTLEEAMVAVPRIGRPSGYGFDFIDGSLEIVEHFERNIKFYGEQTHEIPKQTGEK